VSRLREDLSVPAARILSVNLVHAIIPDPLGDVGRTAIDKRPAGRPVLIEAAGPVGDTVLDRKHHGGRDQAVYAYAVEDLRNWSAKLARDLAPGTFGENLTTEGVDVTGAVIGEVWAVDEAGGGDPVLVQVTSPRIPCTTFQAWMGEAHWVRRFTEHGAPGAYLRVLSEGAVAPGAGLRVAERPAHGVTVGEVFQPRFADRARLQLLLDEGEDLHPPLVRRLADQVRRSA
jgi:MOSC domain-containing protein YiiM